jgi:aspartyl-tRNA(Asn)/glutamyl-tRNA(Gln) amidotransferase subunit C
MDKDEVLRLATLARVGITEEEAEALKNEFAPILDYVSQVKEALPKGGVREMAKSSVRNVMRDDTDAHESGIYTEELLNAAPTRDGSYVKVKKIL